MLVFQSLDSPLKTDAAPFGILSFQLAGSSVNTIKILDSWDVHATNYAIFGLGFDYLFMFLYVIAVGLGCAIVSEKFGSEKKFLSSLGVLLSWGLIVAGLADALENYGLTVIMLTDRLGIWPEIVFIAAVVKFFFLIAGMLYMIVGAFLPGEKRMRETA